jgi:LmbE family N-acetylglucosaminyl deacetylase
MTHAVVVAHPDDEVLWLSSVVASASRVVFSFAEVPDQPSIVDLQIPESGAGWKPYQKNPQLTPSGVMVCDAAVRARYESNYTKLLEGLRTSLAGIRDVYTHNPWGEYGHAEHMQVHNAVTAVQAELGYTVWFSNYVGAGNWSFVSSLADRITWAQRSVVKPDKTTARDMALGRGRHSTDGRRAK